MTAAQKELPLFRTDQKDPNVAFLVSVLHDAADWLTAAQIIELVFARTQVKWHERKVRELAEASGGEIAGGQQGYKLVRKMTNEEYNHFRNWMRSQARKMETRVLLTDHVFYQRQPIKT